MSAWSRACASSPVGNGVAGRCHAGSRFSPSLCAGLDVALWLRLGPTDLQARRGAGPASSEDARVARATSQTLQPIGSLHRLEQQSITCLVRVSALHCFFLPTLPADAAAAAGRPTLLTAVLCVPLAAIIVFRQGIYLPGMPIFARIWRSSPLLISWRWTTPATGSATSISPRWVGSALLRDRRCPGHRPQSRAGDASWPSSY